MSGVRELLVKFGGKVDSSLPQSGQKASREISGVGDAAERASRKSQSAMGGIGAGIKGVAGMAAGLVAGIEVVGTVWDAIGEAQEARKVGAATEQIIRSTGGAAKVTAEQVGELAERLSNKIGVDDEAIQSSANLLLTFKQVRNEVGKGNNIFDRATAAAQDMAAAGFGDAEGAAKMLGKALNDPVKGVNALGRAGVTFTDAQKKQIKALVASGKTLEAQKMIMKEVEGQVGGVAEKTATASDKLTVMWGNTKEALGTELLPVVDWFANVMTGKVLPAVQDGIKFAADFGRNLGGVWSILTEGDFKGAASTFGLEEDSQIVGWLFTLREGISGVWNILSKGDFTGPIFGFEEDSGVVDVLFRIREGIMGLPDALSRSKERATPFFEYLVQLATGLAEGFRVHVLPAVMELVESFSRFAATVRPIVAEIVTWVMARFAEWGPTIKGYMVQIGAIIGDAIRFVAVVIQRITQVIGYVWQRWGQGILSVGTGVFGALVRAIGGALNVIQGIVRLFVAVLKGDWGGAWTAIKQTASGAWTVITQAFRAAHAVLAGIAGAIRDVLTQIWHSAKEKAIAKFGELKSGIEGKLSDAKEDVKKKAEQLRDGVVGVFSGIATTIGQKFQGIAGAIAAPLRSASGWLNTNVLSPMNNVTSKFGVTIPQIPKFHSGGVVPGRRELGAILLGGEGVLSRSGLARLGGREALDALNSGRMPANAGGKVWDWIKKPAQWAAEVAKSGIAWGLGKLFDAGAGVASGFPPPMAGPLLAGALGTAKGAANAWAKGKDTENQFGDATHFKLGPVSGNRSWPTTSRALSGNYPGHSGIDIPVPVGTPMYAAADGVVTYTGWGKGYGNAIFANLAGMPAVYGHGSRPLTRPGDRVRAGQVIGLSGNTGRSTGPHVHFEVAPGGFARPGNRAATLRWLGYDAGGWLMPGVTPTVNNTGKPEAVLTSDQWERLFAALEGLANGGRSVVVDGRSVRAVIREEVRAAVRVVRDEGGVLR